MTKIKRNYYIFFILIVGFFLRLWMISLDPFLQNWDEHFHALVAKNFSQNFLFPVLIKNPVIEYNISEWNANHVWVHKQPFFLWQIALSIKLFGTSIFAVRLPSLIMTTISLLIIFRLTYLLTKNYKVSFIALILFTFSNFQLNLISGRIPTDHNDVAFGFYVLMSIWSFSEFLNSRKWYWVVLTGLFSGFAVLIKWLLGILVYSSWGLISLFKYFKQNDKTYLFKLLFSFLICVLVFLPWQLYISKNFPIEFLHESEFNRKHFFEVLEGHGGSFIYYIKNFRHYYGYLVSLFVVYGSWVCFKQKLFKTEIGFSYIFYFILLITFFSFFVATKMNAFVYSVIPFGIIFASVGIFKLAESYKLKPLYISLCLMILTIDSLKPYDIWKRTYKNNERVKKEYNTNIYKKSDKLIPDDYNVIINLSDNENIDLMFYSKRNLTAYQGVFSETQLKKLSMNKVKIAAFTDHGNFVLPKYIMEYPYLYIINEKLKD
jgi:4-amino-4-deoxy-L-arabinose transferase-like glycosyltransferase